MITIKVKDLELTLNEAEDLYNELRTIFERPITTWYPLQSDTIYGDQIPCHGITTSKISCEDNLCQ